ncbi:MAG: methyltransferase domain-containing protein [Phycisphaerae bacterium]
MSTPAATLFHSESALAHLQAAEDRHFWFASRNRYIDSFFQMQGVAPGSSVLEVGCGSGTVLRHLHHAGYDVAGVELNPELADAARHRLPGTRVLAGNVCDESITRSLGAFDVVSLFDVLEHAPDPDAMLQGCSRAMKPGGLLIGTVPSLQLLWSAMDDVSGHRVRHTRSSLRGELKSAGFEPVAINYFFQSLVPVIWWQRRSLRQTVTDKKQEEELNRIIEQGLQLPHPITNSIARLVCGVERRLSYIAPLRAIPGASLLFAARFVG